MRVGWSWNTVNVSLAVVESIMFGNETLSLFNSWNETNWTGEFTDVIFTDSIGTVDVKVKEVGDDTAVSVVVGVDTGDKVGNGSSLESSLFSLDVADLNWINYCWRKKTGTFELTDFGVALLGDFTLRARPSKLWVQ